MSSLLGGLTQLYCGGRGGGAVGFLAKKEPKMDQARFHRNGKSDFDDLGLVSTGKTRATNVAKQICKNSKMGAG